MKSPVDYRPISVSNTLSSILESILLSEMGCFNNIHKHQFGSKKKLTSKHAYFLVNEISNYYRKNVSNVHILSLDACKAFDKLWRDGLFFKLKDKVSEPIWRILFNYYKHSKIIVKYDNNLSQPITYTEGVKQGGILSSYLFNYFINELLEKCTNLNIGASINGLNLSIIAYCDDIVIISPSFGQAVKLLEKCFDYLKEWKIDFNPKKSVCLSLSSSGKILNTNIISGGTNIPNVQGFEYLGLPLGTNNYKREFIEEKWKKV
ncbi:unnamed protein product [Brachionus calyciflorus]|uniref:Reverse transcriptase domain-containing protein n=1 Tax=Brachionus calyciflorus TaxID=104777 RepID=A0A814EIM4_9BILA|nr:unnamed protein product [Brachionus calyciflorus]